MTQPRPPVSLPIPTAPDKCVSLDANSYAG